MSIVLVVKDDELTLIVSSLAIRFLGMEIIPGEGWQEAERFKSRHAALIRNLTNQIQDQRTESEHQ